MGRSRDLDSATLWKRYEGLLDNGAVALTRELGTDARPASPRTISATYRAPYLAHAPMEPMNCTALFTGGALELWMPNQSPTLVRLAAARASGLSQAAVTVHTTFLGGGFGRRAEVDLVREAVACALQMPGRPVQVLWSREEDIRHDMYRPMALARWTALFDDKGLAAVLKKQVGQSPTDQFPDARDRPAGAGQARGQCGRESALCLSLLPAGSGRRRRRRAGRLLALGRPFALRPSSTRASSTRSRTSRRRIRSSCGASCWPASRAISRCSRRRRRRPGWGAPLPAGAGRGIALRASFGSIVAQVAEVEVAADRSFRVRKVTCAIDCGPVINPGDRAHADGKRHRLRPVRRACIGEITLKNGAVEQSNFPDYDAVRLADAPEMAVHLVDSGADVPWAASASPARRRSPPPSPTRSSPRPASGCAACRSGSHRGSRPESPRE